MVKKDEKQNDDIVDLMNQKKESTSKKYVGLDVGTGNLVAAVMNENKQEAEITSMRNMFVSVEDGADLSDVNHIKAPDGNMYIFGEHAMVLSNIFGRTCRRPMSKGVISTTDIDALDVVSLMIENLIGRGNGDICCYSIPSPPTDSDMNILYHSKVFERIISQLGYKPIALSQAQAVCYSQCEQDNFSSIVVDSGCGMTNVALVYRKNAAIQFSTTRGGDWIDRETANSLGISAVGRVTTLKEKDLDLSNPLIGNKKERRIREALSFYYKDLISYTLNIVSKRFEELCDQLDIPEKLPIIVSGGTSKALGFLEFFRDTFEDFEDFPIQIKEIRSATDPLTAVAEGCLIYALSKNE